MRTSAPRPWSPGVLLALAAAAAVVASANARGALAPRRLRAEYSCVTRTDCSSHGNCVNGYCACDSGYSGTHCQNGSGGCKTRADCSYHGSCVSGACSCDFGYAGVTCDNGGCPLQCEHGGSPDLLSPSCEYCMDCLGAWTGKTCSVYNTTREGIYGVLTPELQHKAEAQVNDQKHAPYKMLPGWNLLGFSGTPLSSSTGKVPAVGLSFNDSSHVYKMPDGSSVRVPDNIEVTVIDASGTAPPSVECTTYVDPASYGNYVSTQRQQGQDDVVSIDEPSDFYKLFPNTDFVTQCVAWYDTYIASVKTDSQPSRYMAMMLDALPADSKRTSVFDSFANYFGTDYFDQVHMGGAIVATFQHGGCMTQSGGGAPGLPLSDISAYAQTAMQHFVSGQKWQKGGNPAFISGTKMSEPTYFGGNPEIAGSSKWPASVAAAPVNTRWHYASLSKLVQTSEPATASALTAYATNYKNSINNKFQTSLQTVTKSWQQAAKGSQPMTGWITGASALWTNKMANGKSDDHVADGCAVKGDLEFRGAQYMWGPSDPSDDDMYWAWKCYEGSEPLSEVLKMTCGRSSSGVPTLDVELAHQGSNFRMQISSRQENIGGIPALSCNWKKMKFPSKQWAKVEGSLQGSGKGMRALANCASVTVQGTLHAQFNTTVAVDEVAHCCVNLGVDIHSGQPKCVPYQG